MKNKLEFLSNNLSYRWQKWQNEAKTYYLWNKYELDYRTLYHWNKYNLATQRQYQWDSYEVDTTGVYKWDKYTKEVDVPTYYWDKCEIEPINLYPSWSQKKVQTTTKKKYQKKLLSSPVVDNILYSKLTFNSSGADQTVYGIPSMHKEYRNPSTRAQNTCIYTESATSSDADYVNNNGNIIGEYLSYGRSFYSILCMTIAIRTGHTYRDTDLTIVDTMPIARIKSDDGVPDDLFQFDATTRTGTINSNYYLLDDNGQPVVVVDRGTGQNYRRNVLRIMYNNDGISVFDASANKQISTIATNEQIKARINYYLSQYYNTNDVVIFLDEFGIGCTENYWDSEFRYVTVKESMLQTKNVISTISGPGYSVIEDGENAYWMPIVEVGEDLIHDFTHYHLKTADVGVVFPHHGLYTPVDEVGLFCWNGTPYNPSSFINQCTNAGFNPQKSYTAARIFLLYKTSENYIPFQSGTGMWARTEYITRHYYILKRAYQNNGTTIIYNQYMNDICWFEHQLGAANFTRAPATYGRFFRHYIDGLTHYGVNAIAENANYYQLSDQDYQKGGGITLRAQLIQDTVNIDNVSYTDNINISYLPNTLYTKLVQYYQSTISEEIVYYSPSQALNIINDFINQDGYYYLYLAQEQRAVEQYIIYARYHQNLDTSNLLSCTTKPSFDLQTGILSYTLGQGDYYVNSSYDSYYEKIPNTDADYGEYYLVQASGSGNEKYVDTYAGAYTETNTYYQDKNVVLDFIPSKGQYIETAKSLDINAYPHDGVSGSYYYYYEGYNNDDTTWQPGTFISRETSTSDIYPHNGPQGTYYYIYVGIDIDQQTRGEFIAQVTSINQNAYPQDGIQDDIWYVYRNYDDIYICGDTLIGTVSSYIIDAYPQNGKDGNYWYIYNNSEQIPAQGTLIGEVDSTEADAYPTNGRKNDNWYIYTDSEIRNTPTLYIGEVSSDSPNTYPEDGALGDYYYIYIGQRYEPLYIVEDNLLKQGVKYQIDVNTTEDYAPGDVACAEIQFTIFSEPLDTQKYLNLECDYYERMTNNDPWRLIGHFKITDASDRTSTTTILKAYDNVIKTEIDVTSVINNQITYPITLENLFTTICTACGVQGIWDQSAVNGSFAFENNFTINGITGRQVLSLIAEVAAGFIYADADGRIVCRGYLPNDSVAIDETTHTNSDQGIYTTQAITKLNVAMSTDDVGVSYGDGTVLYRIIGNPILYIEDEHEIDTPMQNIYNVLHSAVYTPTTVKIIDPAGISIGDEISVNGHTIYVQSISWDGSGVTISSKGKKERTVPANTIDGSIDALRGKSNELSRSIDATISRITDVQAGLQSQITQTASTLNTRITNEKNALQSQITQSAGSITTSVEAYTDSAVAAAKTEIQQTTDSISATVSSQGNTISSIQQSLNGISLSYNSQAGTASITIGNITVSNLVNGTYVQNQIAGIDLQGYVRFSDLSTSGYTTINGSNITTGTISADRINMTGAISWSDLDSNVQSTILDGGGSSDIPSYIHSTYISSTSIYSPNIYGAIITAGTSADGYIQMASKGMNFVSSAGGNLIGMGYYSSNYNYPYIVFGQGVDAYGTDKGMIKKFSDGIWIGDSDSRTQSGAMPQSGTGIFIQFSTHKFYKYVNGTTVEF